MSISPSNAQARKAGPSPLPSPLRGHSFSRSTDESHNESYAALITGSSRNFESPDVEKMLLGRTSQSGPRDYDIIRGSPASKTYPVASIVFGEKTSPMSNLNIKQGDSFQFRAKTVDARGYLVPASSSLSGLPEELILEIVLYLDIFDILALRETNRRLSFTSRARIIWLTHLSSLLRQVKLSKNAATFLDSLLSTSTLEHIVKRPHAFMHKWFIAQKTLLNPSISKALTTIWSTPPNFRFPTLLPGGRWLIAVCYTYDTSFQTPNNVCLWDLEHGRTKDLPEAQMEAPGIVLSMDVKMDLSGVFAMMSILTAKVNLTGTVMYWVDVYQVKLLPSTFGFFRIDRMALNERRAHEIQIYPQSGAVLMDLFDRVLIWAYSENRCAWLITSKRRHQFQRFIHRAAHAFTFTRKFLLIADGDESSLRGYIIPPLSNRPKQLSSLTLFLVDPVFEHPLPGFATSLSFSTTRLVDIWKNLKSQTSKRGQNVSNNRKFIFSVREPSNSFDRGVLFIGAASCDSYLFCFYPLGEISQEAGSPNALLWTSMSRDDVQEQIWAGTRGNEIAEAEAMRTSMSRPFNVSPLAFGCHVSGSRGGDGDLLWTGLVDEISPSLCARASQPKASPRTVILMRNPENPGGLVILSTFGPPRVDPEDLAEGQSLISEVEQGKARTVLNPINRTGMTEPQAKIIGASVDSISGRVCIVATNPHREHATTLRLLEYS